MENNEDTICITPKPHVKMVHYVLSHSYLMYLFAVLLGMIFDFIYPIRFGSYFYNYCGSVFMILGTMLIYWAQSTSSNTKKTMEDTGAPRHFDKGPYKFSRNPTHIGLLFATLGFALVSGSLFTIIFIVIVFFITKLFFLKKEEKLLEQEYGLSYCEYKDKVKGWL